MCGTTVFRKLALPASFHRLTASADSADRRQGEGERERERERRKKSESIHRPDGVASRSRGKKNSPTSQKFMSECSTDSIASTASAQRESMSSSAARPSNWMHSSRIWIPPKTRCKQLAVNSVSWELAYTYASSCCCCLYIYRKRETRKN